jgi:ATP-dependent Lon protease
VKEKVLAAHRAGIKHVILPERCMADIEEVPQEVRDELEFHPVQKMEDVLRFALTQPEKLKLGPPAPPSAPEKPPEKKKGGKSASVHPAG